MKHKVLKGFLAIAIISIYYSMSVMAETNSSALTDWYPVTVENRPFVRWWWLGNAVDPESITYNLEEFATKGIGGVEITPIYGVKGNESNDLAYLSPEWMKMLDHTIAEGERLGLQIDMNNGTGWPFGGPEVGTEYGARKLIVEKWDGLAGDNFCKKIIPTDSVQQELATLQAVIATNGEKRIDLTSRINSDNLLSWNVPKGNGNWEIYGIFCGRTLQKVKRAAPGGEGFVLNHYDSVAVNNYLDKFDRAFAESSCKLPNTFFNDSYEVYGSDWFDNILNEFRKDHGYSLEMYIPEFLDRNNHSDLRSRVVRDYRYTLANMLRKNFTDIWVARSHSKGARVRNQSHGSPANIIDLYAAVDIPECESFGQTNFNIPGLNQGGPSRPSDADPAVLKFASSAAHITGKRLTSAEALTWLTQHFRTSLSLCKPELDQMFCSGVNHVYFHGAPYSPQNIAFPGWLFYASINMSPTNSIWQDADSLFSYVSRVQSFLSAGVSDNDFLLYFPIDEIWQRTDGNPYLMFDIHKMSQRMPDIKEAVNQIINAGYDVDYISDELLNNLSIEDCSIMSSGGTKYKAVIIPPVNFIQPSTLDRILTLASDGATVIFVGSLPSDVPGLANLDSRRLQLKELLSTLPTFSDAMVKFPYGKGSVILSPSYPDALSATGVKPESMRTEQGLSIIRRRNEIGGYNYFITLLQNLPLDDWVNLAIPSTSIEIFDPLTGKKGMAQTRNSIDGTTQVRLQLEPGQSILLKTFPCQIQGDSWAYVEKKGNPIIIDRGWSIDFPKSEPPIRETFRTDTLTQWCNLPDSLASINFGTGRYTVQFNLDNPSIFDDWLLDLGDVRESADVKINSESAGKVWSVPFIISIGKYLKPGINTLEVDVTNLQANRIADYERRGIEWRIFKDANIASVTDEKEFSFADWPVLPSGLNSTVKLIPISYSK